MERRNQQVSRVIRILSWIEASNLGLTVQEVHTRLQDFGYKTCVRTVYRDIEAIQEAGFPLIDERDSDNRYLTRWRSLHFHQKKRGNRLTNREFISLIIMRGALLHGVENSTNKFLENAVSSIEQNLTRDERGYLDELHSVFKFEGSPISDSAISWDKLERCALAAVGKIAVVAPDSSKMIIDKITFCNGSISVSNSEGPKFDLDQICLRPG